MIQQNGTPHNVPKELRLRPQWVSWSFVERHGLVTKKPFNPAGGPADTTDPATWGGFREAVKAALLRDGIGFVFSADDPYVGVDFDHCRNPETGEFEPWAQGIIDQFQSYTEVSPSGTGGHIIGRGTLPTEKSGDKRGLIEAYHHSRFFTMTGAVLDGFETIIDVGDILPAWYAETFPARKVEITQPPNHNHHIADDDIIERARSARNGQKFESLWAGDTSEYEDDDSSADLALLSLLSFWSQDVGQLDRIFRRSGLFREKWEKRADYRAGTIAKSLERTEYYTPTPIIDHAGAEKVCAASKKDDAAERNELFITARELAEQTPAITHWIAKPWVAENAITEVSGKIKAAGKTTWVLSMCHAVCEGHAFMGIPTTQGAVVFLTEQPAPSFREALARAGLLEQDNFHILQWNKTNGLAWTHVVHLARQYAADVDAVLLVVDTLAQFAGLRGDTENNAGAALEALAPLQLAIADGLGVLLTRHDRKGGGEVGDSARGSSAFSGVVDIVLQIQRGEGNTRPTIRVINALSRFDATPDQLMIELTNDGYVALGDKTAVASDEARNALRDTAPTSEAEAMTEKELLDAVDAKRTVGQGALRSLVDEGILICIGEGKRGNPYRYWRPSEKVSAASTGVPAESNGVLVLPPREQAEFLSAATTPLIPAERNSPETIHMNTQEKKAQKAQKVGTASTRTDSEKLSAATTPLIPAERNSNVKPDEPPGVIIPWRLEL